MSVVRLHPGEACRLCGSTANDPPHVTTHDCLAALDEEVRDLLQRVSKITDARSKIIGRQLLKARKQTAAIKTRLDQKKKKNRPA